MAWTQGYPVFIVAAFFVAMWQWQEYAMWKALRSRFVSWRFSQEDVAIETEHSTSQLTWPAFLHYKEGKRVFLLYTQKNLFHFIPKRALTDREALELRQLLDDHLKKK